MVFKYFTTIVDGYRITTWKSKERSNELLGSHVPGQAFINDA